MDTKCPRSYFIIINMNTSCTTGTTNIVQLPLAFVRSGWVSPGYGYAYGFGSHGYVWSRTTSSSAPAYDLGITPSGVYSESDNSSRYYGYSLRCLYPGSV